MQEQNKKRNKMAHILLKLKFCRIAVKTLNCYKLHQFRIRKIFLHVANMAVYCCKIVSNFYRIDAFHNGNNNKMIKNYALLTYFKQTTYTMKFLGFCGKCAFTFITICDGTPPTVIKLQREVIFLVNILTLKVYLCVC